MVIQNRKTEKRKTPEGRSRKLNENRSTGPTIKNTGPTTRNTEYTEKNTGPSVNTGSRPNRNEGRYQGRGSGHYQNDRSKGNGPVRSETGSTYTNTGYNGGGSGPIGGTHETYRNEGRPNERGPKVSQTENTTGRLRNIRGKAVSLARDTATTILPISTVQSETDQGLYFKLVQSGAINPIGNIGNQMGSAIEEAQGRSRFYSNMKDARKIVTGLAFEGAIELHNQRVVKRMFEKENASSKKIPENTRLLTTEAEGAIKEAERYLSSDNLLQANKYLRDAAQEGKIFDKHAVKVVEQKDIINDPHRAKTINTIRKQSTRLVEKKYNLNVRSMSKEKLTKALTDAQKKGNEELAVLLKNELGFRQLVGKNAIYNSTTVKHTKTRLLRTNVLNNFEAYRGYNDFRRMAYGMATVIRLSAKVYTLPTKGVYNIGSHVHQNAVKIIGHYKGTEASLINEKVEKIKNTRRTVNNTLSGKPLKEFNAKYGGSTTRGVITEAEKAAVRGVKVVGKGAKAAGNTWAAHTNTGKQAKKVYQGFVKQNKKIGKKVQKVLQPFKKAWSSTSLAFKKIASKFNIAKLAVKKFIMYICLGAVMLGGGIVVITVSLSAGFSAATMILDAVGKGLEETSMGVAYTKLMEKEQKFSNALGSLYQTEKPVGVVGEYEGAGGQTFTKEIPKYTKSNINYYDGNGDTLTNGQTIKGILAMAAVYIEQDFAKYGNMVAFESGFGDQENPSMTSLLGSTYRDYVAALYDATHMIGIEADDQANVYYCEDRMEAPYTCNNVITNVDHGTARDNPPEGCDEEHCNTKDIYRSVPSGTDENGHTVYEPELAYTEYTCKANHRRCGGHIDLNADVVISNIYYPESEESSLSEDEEEIADAGDQEEIEENGEPEEVKEPLYSMYALDKYATAFHKSSANPDYIAEADANMDRDTTHAEGTNEPHTEILDIMNNIIKNVEGKENVTISRYVYWPENDPVLWQRNPTYYLIKNDGDINEDGKKRSDNPVNTENATPYRFISYTSEYAFNDDFAKHGWNKASREQVQALLIPDWKELYGISDFGCLTGTPLSREQIDALISSNPEWENLSDARKLLMALSLTLPEGHPYYASGMPDGRYAGSSQPALSCAGYVKWLYWSAFNMENFPIGTVGINSQLQSDPKWEHYVGIQNFDKLEPGDIVCKRDGGSNPATGQWNHVLVYAGKGPNGERLWFHESGSAHGYKQLSTYNFSGYTNTVQIYKLRNIDQMYIDYGENMGGTYDITEVGEILQIGGNEIWIGWSHNESGGAGPASVGDNGHGFGLFQFDSRYDSLYNFMKTCMDEYPGEYEEFRPYYNNRSHYLGEHNTNTLGSAFEKLWVELCNKDPERFRELQINQFYKDYMEPVYTYAKRKGVDLDDYSPVMSGTLWSISVYAGSASVSNGYKGRGKGALNIIKAGEREGKSEDEILREIYTEVSKYKANIVERWTTTQLGEALAVYYSEYA